MQPCAYAGCAHVVPRGYCAEHAAAAPARVADQRRGSSARRGYGYRWQQYRRTWLMRYPICADPDGRHAGQIVAATDVDHIVAVSGPCDPLFWDALNHQSLCHACHAAKTAENDGGLGHGRGGWQKSTGSPRA